MTWEELKARQQRELFDCTRESIKRREQLHADQQETLRHCVFIGKKGPEIMRRIFDQQIGIWRQHQKDDWDALLHAQEHERDAFRKEGLIQEQISEYARTHTGRQQERER